MSSRKHNIASFALAAFLFAALFGFVAMSYGPDGRMMGDCPFSVAGAAACPTSALAAVMHHVSAFHSFLNVPAISGFAALLAALGLFAVLLVRFLSAIAPPPARTPAFARYGPPPPSYGLKLRSWLSLFELSPAR